MSAEAPPVARNVADAVVAESAVRRLPSPSKVEPTPLPPRCHPEPPAAASAVVIRCQRWHLLPARCSPFFLRGLESAPAEVAEAPAPASVAPVPAPHAEPRTGRSHRIRACRAGSSNRNPRRKLPRLLPWRTPPPLLSRRNCSLLIRRRELPRPLLGKPSRRKSRRWKFQPKSSRRKPWRWQQPKPSRIRHRPTRIRRSGIRL